MKVKTRFIKTFGALLIAALFFAVLPVGGVRAQTDPVHNVTQGTYFTTIQAAIDAASDGDMINVQAGTYNENVTIDKNVKLLSTNGKDVTIIDGDVGFGNELGTLYLTNNTDGVQIGDVGQGFTINGIDGSPGLEKSAIYFKGGHTNAIIKGNNIVAEGDAGLMTEWGATVSNFVISQNEFSGATFLGEVPGGEGFSNQFTEPNVPRQLVYIGGNNKSNITFSNNNITGKSGGLNAAGNPQGNVLVTIDAENSTINDNLFEGTTTRPGNGYSLRVRRSNTLISGNDFKSTGLSHGAGHLYLENNALNSALVDANNFDKAVYIEDSAGGSIGLVIQHAIDAASDGDMINVQAGTYVENVMINKPITLQGAGMEATTIEATDGSSTPLTFNANNATVNGFHITHKYTQAELNAWNFNNNGVQFRQNTKENTLTNCKVTKSRNGIYINNARGNKIIDNTIENNRTGINVTNYIDGTQIKDNLIQNNWTLGLVYYQLSANLPTDFNTVTVTGNSFLNNWYSEILIKNALDVPSDTGTLNVTNNTFSDSPVTYTTSADAKWNEPGHDALKPVEFGGTANMPTTPLPTLRIYGVPDVTLQYDNKTLMVGVDQPYTTIQAAIDDASAGDTINVAAGTYDENLVINKALSLLGAGRDITTVQAVEGRNYNGGDFQSPIVKITGDAALLNLLPLEITAPSGIAGEINGSLANFGPQPGNDTWNVSGEIVYADDPLGGTVPTNVDGKIALIDRGSYGFSVKAYNAEQGGAIGVIIANTSDDLLTMKATSGYEDVNIPVIMITQTDGNIIKAQTESVNAAFQDNPYDINGESITISGFTFHGVVPPEVPNPGGATGDWGNSGIEHLTTQGIETDSSIYPYPARQNLTIKDNKFVYAGSSIVLYNVTGFEVSNNIMERASYYYDALAGYEQYKPHGGQIVHTSGGKNGLVQHNTGFNPSGTISIGGSDIVVEGNTIQAPETPLNGDLTISQYGISTLFASNVDILSNTITGLDGGTHQSYTDGWPGAGIWIYNTDSNVYVEGNTLQGNTIGIGTQVSDTVIPPVLRENKFIGNTYSVLNQSGNIGAAPVEVDAKENYWGSEAGPMVYSVAEMGAQDWDAFYGLLDDDPYPFPDYAVSDMVLFAPWCQDQDCENIIPDENGVIEIPAGTSGEVVQQYLNNAPEGTVIKFLGSPGSFSGGFEINNPKLTIVLMDGTVIQNNSPCFVINADETKITTESLGGATCVPTSGSSGIVVGDGVEDIVIEGFEIAGADGNHGIEYQGAVSDVVIRDMHIHDMASGDGVYFASQPGGYVEIKGNLFENNHGFGVNNTNGSSAIDATYNAWGDIDGPKGTPNGDDVSSNVTYDPWTHVDVYVDGGEDSRYLDEVSVGEDITYDVYGNLENAFGAQFTLSFDPAKLQVVEADSTGTVFPSAWSASGVTPGVSYDNVTGKITFNGGSTSAVSGTEQFLFSVTFTGAETTSADNPLSFEETDAALFGMNPGVGSSLNIYASDLVGITDVNVYDLPTLSADPLEDFAVGNPKEFTLTVTNPATGRDYADLNVELDIPSDASLEYWDGDSWEAYGDGVDVGSLAADDTADVDLRINFVADGENVVVVDLFDGSIFLVTDEFTFTAMPSFTLTGSVQMQGRTVRSGVTVEMENQSLTEYVYDALSTSSITGNFTFENVASGPYFIRFTQDRYLDLLFSLEKGFDLTADLLDLERLELRGGDLDNSEEVDVSDASIVGSNYGSTGDNQGDANFDETVNIQDLAMVGGNYNLTSANAYADWLTP